MEETEEKVGELVHRLGLGLGFGFGLACIRPPLRPPLRSPLCDAFPSQDAPHEWPHGSLDGAFVPLGVVCSVPGSESVMAFWWVPRVDSV